MIIRPDAEADLAAAQEWYERKRVGLGVELLLAFESVLTGLERNPELFAPGRKGFRTVKVGRFPYFVHYRIEPEGVIIHAVLHGQSDPRRWQSRG